MNNKLLSSLFMYVDEEGKPLYKVQYFTDGTFEYTVRDRHRKWHKRLPATWVPYNLHKLMQAKDDDPIFFCGNEADADALIKFDLVATCGVPNPFGGEVPLEWGKYLANRHIYFVESMGPTTKDIAKKGFATYGHLDTKSARVTPDGMEPGQDFADWLEQKGWGRFEWIDWLYGVMLKLVEQQEQEKKSFPPAPGEVAGLTEVNGDAEQLDQADKYEVGWKPFPLHCLPDPMQDYCRSMAESIKVDPAYLALPSLIFAAGLIGNSRVVRLNATWPEPSVLFGCLIADSSTRKSPAMDWAARPLVQFEMDFARDYKTKWECFSVKDRAWTQSAEQQHQGTHLDEGESKPRKPVRKRLIISDITCETIIRELENNPRGLILKRDELRAWFSSFGRYKSTGQGGSDLAFWLEVFRASGHIYDRKSGDQTTVAIPRCAISVYGTIQPTVIAKVFTRDYFDSGFVSRLLLVMPPKRAGRWDHYQPDRDVIERYDYLMKKLHMLDWEFTQDADNAPRELIFTPEGDEVWGQWYNGWQENQMNSEGDIASLLAKMEGCCGRFALIFAVCDYVLGRTDTEHVNAIQVTRAIELAEWFKEEAMRIYSFVGMSDTERDADRLIQRIKDKGGYITARELFLMNKSKYRDQKSAGLTLWRLVEMKKLRTVDRIPGRQAGPHTVYFTTMLRDYEATNVGDTTLNGGGS